MKDLTASLRARSERGTPIGSRQLRERVAVELAGARLEPEHYRPHLPGPVIALAAAAVVIIVFGGVALFINRHHEEMAVTTTVTSTETTVISPVVVPPAPTPLEPTPLDLQMTWEELSPDSSVGGRLDSVAVGDRGLVAAGAAADGHSFGNWTSTVDLLYGDAAVWTSEDGRSWTRVSDEAGVFASQGTRELSQAMADLVGWQGGFIAVGSDDTEDYRSNAAVWISPDGVTWTRANMPAIAPVSGPESKMEAVVGGDFGLVAVGEWGNAPAVWLSEDGENWSRLDRAAVEAADCPEGRMSDVAVGGPGLIAAGTVTCSSGYQAAVWVSSDGLSWTQTLLGPVAGGAQDASSPRLTPATISSARTIAVGTHGIAVVGKVGDSTISTDRGTHTYGAVWMSEDGVDWRLSAVLEHGPLEEATTWAYAASADTALWAGDRLLVFGTARQVPAGGGGGSGYALVWASADQGDTWHLITMATPTRPVGEGPAGENRVIVYAPRDHGATPWYSPQALMRDAIALGSRVLVVGGTPNFGSGIVWIGEWADG